MSVQAMAWVLEHEKTTTGTDRLVLLSLANHVSQERIDGPWEAWPGIERIMAEAGVSRRQTVKDSLSRLKAKGLISVALQGAPDSRVRADRRPNLYTIHHDGGSASVYPSEEVDGGSDDGARGLASRGHGGSLPAVTGARETSPEPVLEPVEDPGEEPHGLFAVGEAPSTGVADELFERFWQTCPKRTGKGEARKAWDRAVKRADAGEIIAGMARYAEETRGTEPRFLKTPGPWLNADRWLDEPGANVRGGRPVQGPRQQVGQHDGPAGRVVDL